MRSHPNSRRYLLALLLLAGVALALILVVLVPKTPETSLASGTSLASESHGFVPAFLDQDSGAGADSSKPENAEPEDAEPRVTNAAARARQERSGPNPRRVDVPQQSPKDSDGQKKHSGPGDSPSTANSSDSRPKTPDETQVLSTDRVSDRARVRSKRRIEAQTCCPPSRLTARGIQPTWRSASNETYPHGVWRWSMKKRWRSTSEKSRVSRQTRKTRFTTDSWPFSWGSPVWSSSASFWRASPSSVTSGNFARVWSIEASLIRERP